MIHETVPTIRISAYGQREITQVYNFFLDSADFQMVNMVHVI